MVSLHSAKSSGLMCISRRISISRSRCWRFVCSRQLMTHCSKESKSTKDEFSGVNPFSFKASSIRTWSIRRHLEISTHLNTEMAPVPSRSKLQKYRMTVVLCNSVSRCRTFGTKIPAKVKKSKLTFSKGAMSKPTSKSSLPLPSDRELLAPAEEAKLLLRLSLLPCSSFLSSFFLSSLFSLFSFFAGSMGLMLRASASAVPELLFPDAPAAVVFLKTPSLTRGWFCMRFLCASKTCCKPVELV
mmetsp:Transcript_76421/g.183081  ORF Transcript_76421/g.183081 Transcript_76421/m.183081 type:complete len:243 (+) Transcript_76421:1273-2001(+)